MNTHKMLKRKSQTLNYTQKSKETTWCVFFRRGMDWQVTLTTWLPRRHAVGCQAKKGMQACRHGRSTFWGFFFGGPLFFFHFLSFWVIEITSCLGDFIPLKLSLQWIHPKNSSFKRLSGVQAEVQGFNFYDWRRWNVPRVDFQGVVEEKRSPAVWKKTMFLRPHKVWGTKSADTFLWQKNLELLKECAVILSFSQLFSIIVHVVTTVTLTGWQATDMWSCGASPSCLIRCSCAPMWSGHSLGVLIRFWTARRSCTFCFAVILLSLETLMLESQETWPFRLLDPKLTTLEMEKTHEALEAEILSRVRAGNFSFNDADWRHVSDLAKVGFTGLLAVKLSNI